MTDKEYARKTMEIFSRIDRLNAELFDASDAGARTIKKALDIAQKQLRRVQVAKDREYLADALYTDRILNAEEKIRQTEKEISAAVALLESLRHNIIIGTRNMNHIRAEMDVCVNDITLLRRKLGSQEYTLKYLISIKPKHIRIDMRRKIVLTNTKRRLFSKPKKESLLDSLRQPTKIDASAFTPTMVAKLVDSERVAYEAETSKHRMNTSVEMPSAESFFDSEPEIEHRPRVILED